MYLGLSHAIGKKTRDSLPESRCAADAVAGPRAKANPKDEQWPLAAEIFLFLPLENVHNICGERTSNSVGARRRESVEPDVPSCIRREGRYGIRHEDHL